MICEPNSRRAYRPHAPLPAPRNPYLACTHGPYCAICAPSGTLIKRNHDIEARSWWSGARRNVA